MVRTAADSPSRAVPAVAAILAGGLGTRLRAVTGETPKVLAEVGGRPFIAYLLDRLAAAGVRRCVLCTGFGAEAVRERLGERHGTMAIAYSAETEPLGTGGALRHALPLLTADPVLAMNGDSCCAPDLAAFGAWHAEQRAVASLVTVAVPDTAAFGAVRLDADGRIRAFAEKGRHGAGRINGGIYLMSRRLIAALPAGRNVSLEREALPKWVKLGRVCGFAHDGPFIDIGTPENHALAASVMAAMTDRPEGRRPR